MTRCASVSPGDRLPCYQGADNAPETRHAWLNAAGQIAVAWVDEQHPHEAPVARIPTDRPMVVVGEPQ